MHYAIGQINRDLTSFVHTISLTCDQPIFIISNQNILKVVCNCLTQALAQLSMAKLALSSLGIWQLVSDCLASHSLARLPINQSI